jgi:hypothetical protein
MWVILAGFLVIVVLFVASAILQSAAGPAGDWFHGTTAEDRAHGRGTMEDLSSLTFLIAFLGLPLWVLFALGTVGYLVVDNLRHS